MSRIYTLQDLQHLSLSALHTLRGTLQRDLAMTAPHSREARETLTSLDAVNRVIRQRSPSPRMG